MKREYLNEEEFQKNNKKIKNSGLTIIIIGLCILFFSIFNFILASKIEVPQMGSLSWFEAKSAQNYRENLGRAMLGLGIFVTAVGCIFRFIVGNQRNIRAYQAQQVMPIAQEKIEKMAPSMGNAAKEIAKGIKEGISDDKAIYCKDCGVVIDADSTFCSKCGKQL